MPRKYPFEQAPEALKLSVWRKGKPIAGYDPAIWRRDICGQAMKYSDHGHTNSEYGWEIDHIKPRSKGGKTVLRNLQPLYWEINRRKGETYPWFCRNAA